ncbi:MAG TPA: DUF4136 domain-containing protein [Cytophagales bacterium]|nr:DUF4136 domain-containing protein [Cytophagales bacterium]
MKTSGYALIVGLLVLTGCFNHNKFLVESDYSYQGNFKKYTSFNFANDGALENDSIDYETIKDAIKYQMQIHGYKFTEKKPSILVFYKIFNSNLQYNGYYQPELNEWIKRGNEDEAYDPVKYSLINGTLLIQFVDSKKNQSIWQGYASGVFDVNNDNNERYMKSAVRSIFDKYRMFVEGYIMNAKNDEF